MTAMHHAGPRGTSWTWAPGALLLLLMLAPPIRKLTESSMIAHMLIQYPCLMLAGLLLVREVPARWLSATERWNELGISGFVGSALALALLMIPRVLDLALVDGGVEAMKMLALVGSGAALALSWLRAGVVMQAFFLGNVLWMTAVVGMLYQDAAVRVCNAYRLDDQQDLGRALVLIAIAIGVIWSLHTAWSRAQLRSSVLPVSPDGAIQPSTCRWPHRLLGGGQCGPASRRPLAAAAASLPARSTARQRTSR